jgi:RHS repeat-associated protein
MAASGTMAERLDGSGGSVQWTNYLVAGGELVGMRVENGGTVYTRYFNKDHLGSIAVITDETGAMVERLSYDAWGKRRFPDGSDDPTDSITSQTTRGFTGHEELADVALVHMNGRVYDPLLGRFGTADPTTENPLSTQGWNRYSYVGNSPLNFSDPTGYCFLGCFFQNIFNGLQSLFQAIPILGNILQIAAVAILCATFVCAAAIAALSSAFVAGVTSGNLGAALKAGLISAVTAAAFYAVGSVTNVIAGEDALANHITPQIGTPEYAFNIAGHAAVGCLTTIASGGQCGPGALSGAAGAAAAPLVQIVAGGNFIGGAAASGLVGGLASVAGGGKFANGAETAAFGYLINNCSANPLACGSGGEANDLYSNAQGLSVRDTLAGWLHDNLGVTLYIGYTGEVTAGAGVANTGGGYFDTKWNVGAFDSSTESSGFNVGRGYTVGFQFGLENSFRGTGYTAWNFSSEAFGLTLTTQDSVGPVGLAWNSPGRLGFSTGPTRTCVLGTTTGC